MVLQDGSEICCYGVDTLNTETQQVIYRFFFDYFLLCAQLLWQAVENFLAPTKAHDIWLHVQLHVLHSICFTG